MKWSDYVITAVAYDTTERYIDKVEIRKDNGNTIELPEVFPRTAIISSIEAGYTYSTATLGTTGKWIQGEPVKIFIIHGVKYLRTNPDYETRDNLGELPEL